MKTIRLVPVLFSLFCLLGQPLRLAAQSTAFTYQGRLQDGTNAVTGLYDFEFRLFNAALGGTQQGPTVTLNDLGVTNGLFLAALDFGANFPGTDRFLQLSVRPGASGGAYTALNPRQPITATPYAVRALEAAGLPAGAVSGAMLADGAVTAAKIAPGAVSQLGSPDGSPVNAVQVNTNGLVGLGTNAPQAGLHIAAGKPIINLELLQTFRDGTSFTNLNGASAIAVDGDLMAVAAVFDSGVTLFDVSDPTNPLRTAQRQSGANGFPVIQNVWRAALRSNLLAVASYGGTVSLINVSNRYQPVLFAQMVDGQGGWNELNGIESLAISGNLLAIAAHSDSAVTLVDISNPFSPIKRTELKNGFFGFTNLLGASAVAFRGNTLFIGANEAETVTVVDISNPAIPVKVAEIRTGSGGYLPLGWITSVAVSGNTLAVGSDTRLTLVDVANPSAPIRRVQLDASTQPAMAGYVNSLRFSGNLLAVADAYEGKVALLDVTQPAFPIEIASTKNGGGAFITYNSWSDTVLIGTNLFVTYRDASAVVNFRLTPRPAGLVSDGWVGIGTSRPEAALHVVGNVVVEGAGKVSIGGSSVSLGSSAMASGGVAMALGVSASASGSYATAVGYFASASGSGSTALGYGTDANGAYSIALGFGTAASGRSATALGESSTASRDYSLAAGLRAQATNYGAFVWADGQGSTFTSTADNQFSVRAAGGARFETAGAGLTVDGQQVLAGGLLPSDKLAGTYSNAVNFGNSANSYSGSGAGLTSLNASQLASGSVPATALGNAWQIGGNAGTTAGNHFLGTTDNQPLELKVNGGRALRLEPTAAAPNLIGGYSGNFISNGVVGGFIGGGGAQFFPNIIGANHAAVLGGEGNAASGTNAAVVGGYENRAAGVRSFVGGGALNSARGQGNVIAGGGANSATNDWSAVGGGYQNQAVGFISTIAGGRDNRAGANYATVGGGINNQALGYGSVVPGGVENYASGDYSAAMGYQAQVFHRGSFVWSDSQPGVFQSGTSNQFSIRASGGVQLNNDTSLNFGNQTRQMLNLWNTEYGIGVQGSTTYFRSGGHFSWFRGGSHVEASGDPGTGGSALMRLTSGGNLGLGHNAPAYPLDVQSVQAVGRFTTTNNSFGSVLVLQNTMAAPDFVGAINFDTASSTVGQIAYLADGQMAFRAGGQPRMLLNGGGLTVNGTFVSTSDRNAKADFASVDAQAVLEKVAALPLQSWSYTNRPGVKHVGPMAQDFRAAFGLGEDDKHIATVDADGVALAAIQGLNQKLEEKEAALAELQARNQSLERRLERLEKLLGAPAH